MEDLLDKLKSLETPQIIISALCVVAFGFLCYGIFFNSSSEDEEITTETLELPEDRTKVENYDNKIDAYRKGEEEKENPLSLDFERGLFGEKKEETPAAYQEENNPKVKELQRQIELMEKNNNGLSQSPQQGNTYTQPTGSVSNNSPNRLAPSQTKEEAELEYRKMLLEARNQRMERSQDYSASSGAKGEGSPETTSNPSIEFRAAIYRDQFILPGDRVTLILTEPLTYKGNLFPKNTFLFATANINKSRVLLNITNISGVGVSLVAKDLRDGNIGLYSKRAGELWREYQAESQSETVNDVTDDLSRNVNIPLVGPAIRAFGNFFRKKKYKEADKILLVNNDELILTTNQ